jgi:hypothetical protein
MIAITVMCCLHHNPLTRLDLLFEPLRLLNSLTNVVDQGAENDIRAKFYSLAFKQEYLEAESAVSWKVIDFMFVGDIPYL